MAWEEARARELKRILENPEVPASTLKHPIIPIMSTQKPAQIHPHWMGNAIQGNRVCDAVRDDEREAKALREAHYRCHYQASSLLRGKYQGHQGPRMGGTALVQKL